MLLELNWTFFCQEELLVVVVKMLCEIFQWSRCVLISIKSLKCVLGISYEIIFIKEHFNCVFFISNFQKLIHTVSVLYNFVFKNNCFSFSWRFHNHWKCWQRLVNWRCHFFKNKNFIFFTLINKPELPIIFESPSLQWRMCWRNRVIRINHKPLVASFMGIPGKNVVISIKFSFSTIHGVSKIFS